MNTTARIRDWLEQGDFNGEGCRHSYLTIALGVGCSETHAIRCVRELERTGEVDVERAPRGSKCPNTYRVRNRNPRLRGPVLARLSEIKLLRRELCQSKGTAGSRGSNHPGKDNRPNVVDQRCGRARPQNSTKTNFGRTEALNCCDRRGCRMQESARSPLRLVGCPECERRQRAIDAMTVDLDNLEADLKAKRRRITQLENELADKHHTDPAYATAEVIFDYWRKKCMPTARTFSEDRVKAVLGRLKDRCREDPKESAYSPRYICEAIIGAAVDPYVDERGEVHNDLELICRNGRKLENFHRRYERWRMGSHR